MNLQPCKQAPEGRPEALTSLKNTRGSERSGPKLVNSLDQAQNAIVLNPSPVLKILEAKKPKSQSQFLHRAEAEAGHSTTQPLEAGGFTFRT